MNIKFSSNNIGSCIIKTDKDITKQQEYAIKGLAMLQLGCMTNSDDAEEDNRKFKEFLDIIQEAIIRVGKIYNEDKQESSLFEQF